MAMVRFVWAFPSRPPPCLVGSPILAYWRSFFFDTEQTHLTNRTYLIRSPWAYSYHRRKCFATSVKKPRFQEYLVVCHPIAAWGENRQPLE